MKKINLIIKNLVTNGLFLVLLLNVFPWARADGAETISTAGTTEVTDAPTPDFNSNACLLGLASILKAVVHKPVITVIAGTNRAGSNSSKVAQIVARMIENEGATVNVVDLEEIPPEILVTDYFSKERPAKYAEMQDKVVAANSLVFVIPEYNGAAPGALKTFLDYLPYPNGVSNKLVTFVGIAASDSRNMTPTNQISETLIYQSADLHGTHTLIPLINAKLSSDGKDITDQPTKDRLLTQIKSFVHKSILNILELKP